MRQVCRAVTVVGLAGAAAVLCLAGPVAARSTDPQCKGIREAVGANHTFDQIMKEFDTDGEHIMKCVQPKGHSRKPAKPAHVKKAAAPHAQSEASSHQSSAGSPAHSATTHAAKAAPAASR
jgi:hypothetical protein